MSPTEPNPEVRRRPRAKPREQPYSAAQQYKLCLGPRPRTREHHIYVWEDRIARIVDDAPVNIAWVIQRYASK